MGWDFAQKTSTGSWNKFLNVLHLSLTMSRVFNPTSLRNARLVSRLRLVFAIVASPAIPIAWIALPTSGSLWSPAVYLGGYLAFAVTGMPLVAYAYVRRRLFACVVCGGIASILPWLLLASLSMFSTVHMTARTVFDLANLAALGGVGGAIFWLISFLQLGSQPRPHKPQEDKGPGSH